MNNVFTVVCMYPEYATEDYGTDTVIRTVEATNAFEASRLVQRIAIREAYVAIKQPSNFQVIAVFPGHVRPATSASSPTGATHPHPPTRRPGSTGDPDGRQSQGSPPRGGHSRTIHQQRRSITYGH